LQVRFLQDFVLFRVWSRQVSLNYNDAAEDNVARPNGGSTLFVQIGIYSSKGYFHVNFDSIMLSNFTGGD